MALPKAAAMKSVSSRKSMKSMKVSTIAKSKRAKMLVFSGKKTKTSTGLRADDLIRNKRGKIVSKKKQQLGKSNFRKGLYLWNEAVTKARAFLRISGFRGIKKGTEYHDKVQSLYLVAKRKL